jgi:transcriptional regulator with XRE-family HTH domain
VRAVDPIRDDAGVRLRALRLCRGMTQVPLAELACISPALVSMVETGQRSLHSANHVLALADVLRVSAHYLASGWEEAPAPGQRTSRTAPFPARSDSHALARHEQLAHQFSQLTCQDGAPPGTGCAAWPVNPPSTHGCYSTS